MMWTPLHVLDAFLNDPDVPLIDSQRHVLEYVCARLEAGEIKVEVVTNPDLLPNVLYAFTRSLDEETNQHFLTFVTTDFKSDEETIQFLTSRPPSPILTIPMRSTNHVGHIMSIIGAWPADQIFSVYIGDYFLAHLGAVDGGNRIINRLAKEHQGSDEKPDIQQDYGAYWDQVIQFQTVDYHFKQALKARKFDECRKLKRKLDALKAKMDSNWLPSGPSEP